MEFSELLADLELFDESYDLSEACLSDIIPSGVSAAFLLTLISAEVQAETSASFAFLSTQSLAAKSILQSPSALVLKVRVIKEAESVSSELR